MDSSFPTSHGRAYDSPKSETGLAEWTSKIKALQREVDADEEAEQRILEEEIAAARQARLRRSRGAGGGSRVDSSDMSSSKEQLQKLDSDNDIAFNDTPKSVNARKIDQETALRKLMGRNEVYNPDKINPPSRPAPERSGSDSVSLAAFIGGRATGPRLNRHAPQQDAHDPTQFTQPDLSASHPVFGRGGVAMPGMAPKKETKPILGSELSETYRPSSSVNAKLSSASVVSTYGTKFAPKLDEPSIRDKIDLNQRSFTAATKQVFPPAARYTEKTVPSADQHSKLAPKTFQAPAKDSSLVSTQTTNTYKSPTTSSAPLTSVGKIPSFPSSSEKEATSFRESSFPLTKPLNFSRSNGSLSTPLNAVAKSPSLASLSKKDETATPELRFSTKALDTSRSVSATPFSAVPNSPPFTSLSKNEGTPTPLLTFSSTKSWDTSRSTPAPSASKVLPTYMATGKTAKPSNAIVSKQGSDTADTPLHRLMERNKVFNPDKLSADPARKSIAERAQSVSLAGFIGGNAGGPRLNRHAPQPDAHDPSQFVQPDTSAPHPIFGRGGIALPGISARKGTDSSLESSERYQPSSTAKPKGPLVKSIHDAKDERPVSPQKTGSRERTTSAPGTALTSNISYSSNWPSSASGRQSPTKGGTGAPARDRTFSGPSYPQSALNSYDSSRSSILHSPFSRSSISTPSLNRPIQRQSKAISLSPQIPVSTTTPSPAFQKPPPPKDLTPSISRLQGRGFVQNMVKVSTNLESSPSPSPASDRVRPVSAGGRKSSVLERWQHNTQSPSPTKLSYPISVRRSTTQEPSRSPIDSPHPPIAPSFNGNGAHVIKSVASLPSMSKGASTPSRPLTEELRKVDDPFPRSRTPGLGSATTMVLIKPKKSVTDLKQPPHVDELGIKQNFGSDNRKEESRYRTPPPLSSSPQKPLIHMTKECARKPTMKTDLPSAASELFPTASTPRAPPNSSNHSVRPASTISRDPKPPSLVAVAPLQPEVDASSSSEGNVAQVLHQCDAEATLGKLSVSAQKRSSDSTSCAKSTPPVAFPEINPTQEQTLSPKPEARGCAPISAVEQKPSPIQLLPDVATIPSPPSPSKHSRIPSTGNRPTVMQVAQDFLNYPTNEFHAGPIISEPETVRPAESPLKARTTLSQMQAERRKSSYEKYSAIILPPLKEETTPTPSPAGTLTRVHDRLHVVLPHDHEKRSKSLEISTTKGPEVSSSSSPVFAEISEAFPEVNISELLNSRPKYSDQPANILTISVEVLAITGTTATPLSRNLDIFYDTEILTIVHRTKSKSTGLASTTLWCWLGRRSLLGDREERKVHELSKRYGTSEKIIHQLAEPAELIQTLGGRLAIRQGTRTHWSAENTSMHLVRSFSGVITIDEHDLNIKNLCSAFSYCITLLGSVYVWHGRGSTLRERAAALKYTEMFSADAVLPIELTEGEDDNDEMFWMIMGDDTFAKADYWQWRRTSDNIDTSVWRIEHRNTINPVIPTPFISMERDLQRSIYLLNCIWEIFVLVGKEARSDKQAIRFALDVGMQLSKESSSSRPYTPTVHVLILPSQIPLDLRLGVRDLDEAWLNDGEIPDHINLLPYSEAVDHLSISSWEDINLKDSTMLPLGIGSTGL